MNKKILWGVIALLLILGGGYFYVNKINAQVEEIAKATLERNNIANAGVTYSCLDKKLTIKNIVFPYSDNEVKIDNSAEEIIIKGINADSFTTKSEEKALLCDEIILNNIKSTVYAYGNEELASTTEQVIIEKPLLNLLKLIALHRTNPYSEEYFQNLLDIRHHGVKIQNIAMQAFKGSKSEASFTVKDIELPAYSGDKFNIIYHAIDVKSTPLNLNIAEIDLKNIALPTAKYLADLSQTIMHLNALERSSEFENNPETILQFEKLSDLLIKQLLDYPASPIIQEVKVLNSAFYLNEIEEIAQSPITFKELSYLLDENDKALNVTSKLSDLTIAKEFLKNIVSPASLELFTEKFAKGMVFSFNQSTEYTKENGDFSQDGNFTVNELASLSGETKGKILNKDESIFFKYNPFFADMTFDEAEELLTNVSLKSMQVSYNDSGLIDFAFKVAANETGFPAASLKEEVLNALQSEKSAFLDSEDALDREIGKIIGTLIETLQTTGKFLGKVTLNDDVSLLELIKLEDIPNYTLEVSSK